MTTHTLSVLVENKPGVLARVAGLFSRRGFNIHSLAVGPTETAEISRMTIVVAVDELPLEQVTKQLNKLVNVIKIVELDPDVSVQRELLLVKVRADATVRSQVLETVQLFRAKVIDVSPEALKPPVEAYKTIRKELESYSPVLAAKPEIVVATKMDVTGAKKGVAALKKKAKKVLEISAATGEGLKGLIRELFRASASGDGVE